MTHYSYTGSELDIFGKAGNWKTYYRSLIREYFGDEVLEVGAGIGATTESLCAADQTRWVCLEPDPALAKQIECLLAKDRLPQCCELRVGTILDLSPREKFDTILYIDVLEHIEDDRIELQLASTHLKVGGFLIVLAPAHQQLFTKFDTSIGHYRRYNKRSLSQVVAAELQRCELYYVDSVGAIASAANRFVLRSEMPTARQIAFWDGIMVPVSRMIDPLLRYSFGKSVLGVWRKAIRTSDYAPS